MIHWNDTGRTACSQPDPKAGPDPTRQHPSRYASDKRNPLGLFPPPVFPIVRPLAFPVFSVGCKTLPIAISDDEKLPLSKSRIVRVTCSLVLSLLLAAPLAVFRIVGVPFSFEPSLAFQRWAGRG
jgi:hypothetical protein